MRLLNTPVFKLILPGLILLACQTLSFSQQSPSKPDSITPVKILPVDTGEQILIGYDRYARKDITSAISTIPAEAFNQGLISDPALLIQGRVPGVQVYNRGGDPNLASLIRVRGLSGYADRKPLIVIDGVAGASLQNLDPNDIASVTVLRDGSAQAIYGIRASNGVLLIETREGSQAEQSFAVDYQGQLALSTAYPGIPVMSADEFRAAGGLDLGASTNWLDEVKRDGVSQMHGLALKGKQGRTSYRLAGNYRNVEGVLQRSGFEQINVRANLGTSFFKEALNVHISASYTDRSSELGFNEAFRYAVSSNPTAPVLAEDAPFAYNTEEFAGFFETKNLFDDFNPKAIVELNDRNSQRRELTTAALLEYKVRSDLSLNVRYAYQDRFSNERAYYPPESYFRGYYFFGFPDRKGSARLSDVDDEFSLYEAFVNYHKALGTSKLGLTIGTSYQDGRHADQYLALLGFSNEGLVDVDRIDDYQNWQEEAAYTDTVNNSWSDKLSAFFGRVNLSVKDKLTLHASLRYEGSSKLGENQRWGIFPAFGAALDLGRWWKMPADNQLRLRFGYGLTGGLPQQGGLSQVRIVRVEQDDGSFLPDTLRYSSPDLKWEEKSEVNWGLDFRFGKLEGYVDWYSRKVKDWIAPDEFWYRNPVINQNSLKSSGVDIRLELPLFQGQNWGYTTGVLFSAFQTKYEDLAVEPMSATSVGGTTQDPPMPMQEGEELGVIVGPVFIGADPNGDPVYEDVNGDGMIAAGLELLYDPRGDFQVVGNGLPDVELGWSHHVRFRGWHLRAFFRGAFGHSLVNRQRQLLEPLNYSDRPVYNLVNTELAIEGLRNFRFSSLYVEKANFLKLDNLTLARSFALSGPTSDLKLNVSLTGQNLFVITNYTGPDPEPALEDRGATSNGSEQPGPDEANPLAPGIDRRNYYLPARTVVLGIGLAF